MSRWRAVRMCDFILVGGLDCHVKRIGCNLRVSPPETATEQSTWGKVKSFFTDLF